MNVGYDKYHTCGPSCTCKGVKVPCLVAFYEGGGISGHILTNVLRHLGDMELYDNDRENGILLLMLIDGHGSRFDLFFLQYSPRRCRIISSKRTGRGSRPRRSKCRSRTA